MAKKRTPYKAVRWLWFGFAVLLAVAAAVVLLLKISDYITCAGKIEPGTVVPLLAPANGIIEFCAIEEGREVSRGTEILRIDSRLEENTLKLYLREQASQKAALENLLERQKLQEEQITSVEEHAWFRSNLDNALRRSGSLTEVELAERIYQREQESLNLTRAQITLKGEIAALENSLAVSRLKLERQRLLLEEYVLKAPLDGTLILPDTIYREPQSVNFFSLHPVTGLHVKKGSLVGYQTYSDTLVAKVSIPERKIGHIEVGAAARVSFSAFPGSEMDYFSGTLVHISASAQNQEFIGTIELDTEEVLSRVSRPEILTGTSVSARLYRGDSTLKEKILRMIGQ